MGIRRMQGTSAYLEYIGPKGKKKKRNCIYYKDNKCSNIKSPIYLLNCIGRMYCSNYDDLKTEEKRNSDEYENNLIYQKKYKEEKDRINRSKNNYLNRESLLNKEVILLDIETNEVIDITIVEEKDKDILSDKISIESPLGRALCRTSIGSEFEVVQGSNTVKYIVERILRISI